MSYLKKHGTGPIPQSEPLPGQVENSAGGYAWDVDKWTRLSRFLILGSEGGSYYANERDLTLENIGVLDECLAEDWMRTLTEIRNVSHSGRAPKNDQAVFALAYCVANAPNLEAKKGALQFLPDVCRIGTHLFQFADFLNGMNKFSGRSVRKAVADWYLGKEPDALAYGLVKYRQREGWTHRDILRLIHPPHNPLFSWTVGKDYDPDELPDIIEGFEKAQRSESPTQTAKLIREYSLPREAVNNEHLTHPEVFQALLDVGMPMTALIRNLANMTRVGLLTPTSEATGQVVRQLSDGGYLTRSRVHPFNVLVAMRTYASGHSFRGDNSWSPVVQVVDALDGAFYAAFGNVTPTNKRTLLALDVSGSMGSPNIANTNVTPREGAAAMALVTAAVEAQYECVAFSHASMRHYGSWAHPSIQLNEVMPGLISFPLSARERLDDVVNKTGNLPFSGTDCSLPILYAEQNSLEVDTFVIYTDSETWAGLEHPVKVLDRYRRMSGINARMVVVGMVSNGFSIADPNDPGMMDVVGFDTAAPELISAFARGEV